MTLSVNDVGFGSRYHLDVVVGDELAIARASVADDGGRTTFELRGEGSSRVSCDTSSVAGTFARVDLELVVRLAPHVFVREALPLSVAMVVATVAAAVPWVLGVDELPLGYVPLLVGPVVLAFALATRNVGTPIVRAIARPLQAALAVQLWALIVVVALLVVFRFPLHVSTVTGPDIALLVKAMGTCVMIALSLLGLDVIFRARWGPYRQLLKANRNRTAPSDREDPPL